MTIFEMEKVKMKEEGKIEGKAEGKIEGKIEERNLIKNVIKLLKQNTPIKDIAEQLNISQNEVKEIKIDFAL